MGSSKTHEMNLDKNTVISGIKALFNIIEKSKDDKGLFEDELPIFLQFTSVKIGKTPSRVLRIPLTHSLLKDSGEVCLIVEDMKGRKLKEYEKTVEHYENLLREKGVTNIKTVMTYYQLRPDYSEYELKRKLVELYDIFLVDGKLSGYVVKKFGKIFRNKRKSPISVRLDATNLKEHLKFALSKTSTNLHPRGDNFVIQVAHSDMRENQVYDNIIDVCKMLSKDFPGGWPNIRSLNIKTAKSISVPIYYTLQDSSTVPVPVVKAKRPKAFKAVTGELSTANDREVTVLPSGEVILKKTKHNDQIRATKKRKASEEDSIDEDTEEENFSDSSFSDVPEDSDEFEIEPPKRKIAKLKKSKQSLNIKTPKIVKGIIKKTSRKERETSHLLKERKSMLSDQLEIPEKRKSLKLKSGKKKLRTQKENEQPSVDKESELINAEGQNIVKLKTKKQDANTNKSQENETKGNKSTKRIKDLVRILQDETLKRDDTIESNPIEDKTKKLKIKIKNKSKKSDKSLKITKKIKPSKKSMKIKMK